MSGDFIGLCVIRRCTGKECVSLVNNIGHRHNVEAIAYGRCHKRTIISNELENSHSLKKRGLKLLRVYPLLTELYIRNFVNYIFGSSKIGWNSSRTTCLG